MAEEPKIQTGADTDYADAKELNGKYQDMVDYCFELYDTIKESSYRKEKIKEIEESIRAYRQDGDPAYKNFPWENASNIALPLTTITNDNLEPRLLAGLVGRDPIVNFSKPANQSDDPETRKIEDWWNSELKDVVKLPETTGYMLHKLLQEGTIYRIPRYAREETVQRDFQFDQQGYPVINPENGQPVIVEMTIPTYEGGKIDAVPFTDVFVPDDADDWEKTPVIRVAQYTYAELMRSKDKPGYQNIGKWLIRDQREDIGEDQQSPVQKYDDVRVTGKKTIDCLECHISYIYKEEDQEEEDIEDFTEHRVVALIAKESRVLIYVRMLRDLNWKNEHLIRRMRLFAEEGKSYGTTMYGKMKAIQDGASKIFNQVINISYLTMLPWYLYSKSSGMEGDVDLYPGKGVAVDNPNEVVFPKFQVDPRQYVEFVYMFTSLWERLSSIGDLQIGRFSEKKGDHTATETLAVIQEGNIKHNYQSKMFREEYLGIIRVLYDLYYQYMPLNKQIEYNGQVVPLNRSMMRRQKVFYLTGSTEIANKLIERKENEDLFMLFSNDPLIDPLQLRKDILLSYNRTDLNGYINPQFAFIFKALAEGGPNLVKMVTQNIQEVMQKAQEMQGGRGGARQNAGRPSTKPGVPALQAAGNQGGKPSGGATLETNRTVPGLS